MLNAYPDGKSVRWKDADEVFDWWIYGGENMKKDTEQEERLF